MLKADNLTANSLDNMVALTCHKHVGLHGLLQGELYFIFLLLLAKIIRISCEENTVLAQYSQ
jgi:hypothetical protein